MFDEVLKKIFEEPFNKLVTLSKEYGWIAWLLVAVWLLSKIVPELFDVVDVWKGRVIAPIARKFKFRILQRAAIKYDVRGHVNRATSTIAAQLPDGWISHIDVKFVDGESRAEFFANNKPVVHIRPLEDQERNIATVISVFLRESLFGDVRSMIPDVQRTAAIFYFGDRICETRGEATLKAFGQYVIEPAIKDKDKILAYYQRYRDIDERGFFTGPFVREVKHVAEEVRASRFHNRMSEEMNEVLKHLEEFAMAYEKAQHGGPPMGDAAWNRKGILTKYGLMLVAAPYKADAEETQGYVNRALAKYRDGTRRLYVLGTADQRKFASKVIKEIEKETPYVIEQKFALYRDYRGTSGGVGAVFTLDPQAALEADLERNKQQANSKSVAT